MVPQDQFLKARPDTMTEGTMTKDSSISLIAAAALFGMGVLSIASAFHGRVAFDNQPDAMVTQLYASDTGGSDRQDAVLASNVPASGNHVSR
jgi:hypothetical protein